MKMIQSAGKTTEISSVNAIALYDPKTGRVAHLHHIVVFEGGATYKQEEHERNAVQLAQQLGHDTGKLRTLFVPDFKPEAARYKVDIESKKLVEIPAPKRERIRVKT